MASSSGEGEEAAYIFKLVIVGDSSVGKSSLLLRYTKDEFTFDSKTTIGVEFYNTSSSIEGKKVTAQLWDTAGQEKFRAVSAIYYRGAHGAMLVYDITNRESFEGLKKWLTELRNHALPSVVCCLVGNKSDMAHARAVPTEEAMAFAKKEGLSFFEASALNSSNVEASFKSLLTEIYKGVSSKQAMSSKEKETGPKAGKTIIIQPDSKDGKGQVQPRKKNDCC